MDQITSIAGFVLAFALLLPVLAAALEAHPRLLRVAKYGILAVYALANLYETILFRAVDDSLPVKLEVLWSYKEALTVNNDYGGGLFSLVKAALAGRDLGIEIASRGLLKQIILNILLYVPMGYLLPFTWNGLAGRGERTSLFRPFPWKVLLIGFLCSCLTEVSQLVFRIGWFELDDILNNTFGCFLGCTLYLLVMRRRLEKEKLSH